jgi:hypothetical protein
MTTVKTVKLASIYGSIPATARKVAAHKPMSRATAQMRHFAKRLIVFEAKQNKSLAPKPAFSITEKFRSHLVAVMGNGGFQALMSRALSLAKTEVACLRSVQVNADGSLVGFEELHIQVAPDEFLEGQIVLLAQLLGLLVVFIGEKLTLGLVREIWAKIPLDHLDMETKGKNETRGINEKPK